MRWFILKLNISDPKTAKTYSVEADDKARLTLLNKKIKDEVNISIDGQDYKFAITGGSDKQGFPMHPALEVQGTKKILLSGGVGFKPTKRGERKKKRVGGRTVIESIQQVNLKLISGDVKMLDEKYTKKKEEKKE
jgi:small subunit ribosomal protein S6e